MHKLYYKNKLILIYTDFVYNIYSYNKKRIIKFSDADCMLKMREFNNIFVKLIRENIKDEKEKLDIIENYTITLNEL